MQYKNQAGVMTILANPNTHPIFSESASYCCIRLFYLYRGNTPEIKVLPA
ncbi:hypothetical protein [Lyngbya aestuarii]